MHRTCQGVVAMPALEEAREQVRPGVRAARTENVLSTHRLDTLKEVARDDRFMRVFLGDPIGVWIAKVSALSAPPAFAVCSVVDPNAEIDPVSQNGMHA